MRRLLTLLLLTLLCCCQPTKPTLYLYSWFGYVSPEQVRAFEAEYNCRVVLEAFSSNEAMLAKLRSGAGGYDIAMPSLLFVQIMAEQNLIQPLNREWLTHYHELDHDSTLFSAGSDNTYSVPYLADYSTIGYRQDRIQEPPASWALLGDTHLKGRVTILDDVREAIGCALKFLGYSANSRDPAQIWEAARQVRRWRDNIAKFEVEQYRNGIVSGEFLAVHALSDDLYQVQEENPDIQILLPREGGLFSCDHFVILKDSKNPELAHRFIDFMCRPEVAAANIRRIGAISPVSKAYLLLEPELRNHPALNPPTEFVNRSELIKDVGQAQQHYLEAWDWARNQ